MKNNNSEKPFIINESCNQFPVQFEIDTVKLFIGLDDLSGYDLNLLMKKVSAEPFGKIYKGEFKGFKLYFLSYGITISGSFSNYFVGNKCILPLLDTKKAVEKLETELGLKLSDAKISRLDINWNTITEKPVKGYNHYLFADIPRLGRYVQSQGVRFENNIRTLVIYDKTTQLEKKKLNNIPTNWLRIEYRVKKDIKRQLGISKLKDVFKVKCLLLLLNEFGSYYRKMQKRTIPNFDITRINSNQEYILMLIKQGIEARGGLNSILEEIDHLDRINQFSNRNQKSRLRKKLININRNSKASVLHPLVEELDSAFEKAFKIEKEKLDSLIF